MPLAHWLAGSRSVPEASSSLGNETVVSVLMWLVCAPVQVMFLPQRPVAAPGKSLLEQLIYPAVMPEEGTAMDLQHLAHLLQQVGLVDLLQRVQGDWQRSQNWQGRSLFFMWHAGVSRRFPCHRGCFQGMVHVWWQSHTVKLHACLSLEHVMSENRFTGGFEIEQVTTCCMLCSKCL